METDSAGIVVQGFSCANPPKADKNGQNLLFEKFKYKVRRRQ